MASWDSQGEIVPIELPNPVETQIWEGENESIRPRQHLILQLPVVITFLTNAGPKQLSGVGISICA